jgi:mannose-6-phosphate isomerase-like protein (cupin superfamily)
MSSPGEGHRSSRIWRASRWIAAGLLVYLVVGNALHHWVFRPPPPDPTTFPREGDEFGSRFEGFHQRILDVDGEWVAVELTLEPGAVGPPLHYHRGFAEEFTVQEGTLHIELADRVVALGPGESYRVEPLEAHRPFNPNAERVVVSSPEPFFPRSFAACLAQLYPRLDEAGGISLSLLLQMSVIDPICDTHLAGVPGPVLATMKAFLAPAARLLGYRNYDPGLALHPPPS